MSTLKRKAGPNGSSPDAKKPKQNGTLTSFFTAPKNGADAPRPAFNKEKWAAGLTEEQRQLLKLEIDTMDESWLAVLKDDIVKPEFLSLKRFLEKEARQGVKVFPPNEDIYSWSRHTPLHSIKVVIVGQDPYHNNNQAHGLAFSVRPPTPAPPSLRNMYIALQNDYPDFTPPPNRGGLLTPWADQGVLMINTCLTVRANDAKSHGNRGWERLTQRVIDLVATRRPRGVVFMAWGTPAAMVVKKVDAGKHLVLKAVHPSPLSAHRGFFTCGHFRKANEWLVKKYGPESEIDWNLGPKQAKINTALGTNKDEAVKKVEVVKKQDVVKTDEVVKKEETLKTNEVVKDDYDDDDWEDAEAERALAEAEAAAAKELENKNKKGLPNGGENGVPHDENEKKKDENEEKENNENGEATEVTGKGGKDVEANGVDEDVKKNGEVGSDDTDKGSNKARNGE